MEGWLKKKGENLGALFWKDRWFKEEGGKLLYYTSASADLPKGQIALNEVTDVRPRTDNFGSSTGFGFEIVTDTRVYCLLASKEAEQIAWLNGLLARIDKQLKFVVTGEEWIQTLKGVARSVVVTIENKTPYPFKRQNFKFHGAGQEWRKFPPENIEPGKSAIFGSCSKSLVTGTAASVTFQTRVDLDEPILWFRWQNPFGKLLTSKKALFEAPSRFKIIATEDKTDSSAFYADSDIYRITYTVTFDPLLETPSRSTIPHNLSHTSLEEAEMMNEWVDVESDGPTKKIVKEGKAGEVVQTSYGNTKYYADWIPTLQSAARSVLVIILNDTDFECKRTDWSLKRGLWRAIPAETLAPRKVTQFGTASHTMLGFKSGTVGSVTYMLKLPTGDYVLTFHWKNHMMWGVSNQVDLTSTVSGTTTSPILVLTESNNDAKCEIVWTIMDAAKAPPTPPPHASSSASQPDTVNTKVIKKTLPTRVQEDGETYNLTSFFKASRAKQAATKKDNLARTENHLEVVAHTLISFARKGEEKGFFSSFFSKEPTLEEEAELVVPTVTASPIDIPLCPITGIKFVSKLDKKYCYLCGCIVHKSACVHLPFPPDTQHSLKELKKPPKPIQACSMCADTLNASARPTAWKQKLATAQSHPVHVIHANLLRNRALVKSSLQDLRKMKATGDKDAEIVVNKILALFAESDDLQMQLFALNEDSPRIEQKVNNTMALFISNWKEEIAPELDALRSEK